MDILNKKIILASKSPRRSQLLREAGFSFQVKVKDVDESYPAHLSPPQVAEYIAQKKAKGSLDLLTTEEQILLTSDTIVVLENTIYGKPKDHADAVRILQELSGKTHQVITGVCLHSLSKTEVFHGVSEVTFEPLSLDEIHFYITNYKPFDKAGAYGIQEWLGHCKISKIKGTHANIMGLPVDLVYKNLLAF